MNIPLPDFLRSYGDMLGPEERRIFPVFVGLVVLVTLAVAWFAIGALIQTIGKWVKRARGAPPELRSPSGRPLPKKKSDTEG